MRVTWHEKQLFFQQNPNFIFSSFHPTTCFNFSSFHLFILLQVSIFSSFHPDFSSFHLFILLHVFIFSSFHLWENYKVDEISSFHLFIFGLYHLSSNPGAALKEKWGSNKHQDVLKWKYELKGRTHLFSLTATPNFNLLTISLLVTGIN